MSTYRSKPERLCLMKSCGKLKWNTYYYIQHSNRFLVLLFLNDIILHTSPKYVTDFRMCNSHQKISLYQLLLILCVEIPPRVMDITPILIILSNIPPVLLHNIFHYYILLLIQFWIYLFQHLFL